jgi:hypothetical protein
MTTRTKVAAGRRGVRGAVLLALGALSVAAAAQEDFVPEGETYIMLYPAAWARARGEYNLNLGFEPFIIRGELGILDYLTVGISYGGIGVLGNGDAKMNPRPGFQGKFRITNGGTWLPAIAVGYDDQGGGQYYDQAPYRDGRADYDRYQFKARGFYGVISQEIEFLGVLGLHLGGSVNFVETKDDRGADLYGGLEKSVGPHLMVVATYDPALNDNAPESLGMGRGYLDGGLRWRVTDQFNVEFWVTNIMENQTEKLGRAGGYNRMLYLTYIDTF